MPCAARAVRAPATREHVRVGGEVSRRGDRVATVVEVAVEAHPLLTRVAHVGDVVLIGVPELHVNHLQLGVAQERSKLVQLALLGVLDFVAELLASFTSITTP